MFLDKGKDQDLEKLAEQEQKLPPEIEEKKRKGTPQTGYTTGTTATAATKGALYALINGKPIEGVAVSLPKGKTATLKIAWTKSESNGKVTCAAIKDGGDDPDATHGAEICSTVSFSENATKIYIDGGKGVGRVTKPGLGLEIGKAAINPIPLQMLEQAIREVAGHHLEKQGVEVVISVPNGEDFAREIFNLPDHCFIQMGDFAGYSIKQCANKTAIRQVIIAGFIGKLTKMAMGVKQTHVAGSHVDMEFMARLAAECEAPQNVIQEIRSANTARHVSEIIKKNNIVSYYDHVCRRVFEQMHDHARGQLQIEVVLFEFDGKVIGRYPKK